MKKCRLILYSLVSLIVLSGCGTPKIDKALENSRSLSSYTMKIESKQADVVSNSIIELDLNNNISKQVSSVDANGISKEITVYSETVDGKVISYTKGLIGDDWFVNESEAHSLNVEEISSIFYIGETEFTKVKSSDKGLYKYEVDNDLVNISNTSNAKCYVYTDGEYIVKIEVISEEPEFSETISFSNINKTEVVVPDEVKENAKKIGEIDFSNIDMSQFENVDLSGIEGLDEQLDKAKEYMNSDEFKNQINDVKEYMNSDDFQKQLEEAQKTIQSEDVQKQIKEAQERAKALLGN